MSFLTQRRTIGFKLESPAYTKATLAAADYNVAAWDINYDPDIAMKARKIARGNFGKEVSISGKRIISITFKVDIQEGATAATPPTYFKCLQACGLKQVIYGTTGVALIADSDYSNVPATIEIPEKDEGTTPVQVVVCGRGAMGNARLVVNNIGEPCSIEFEFKAVLDDIVQRAFASIITPTGFDASIPDGVMGVTVSAYGDIQTLNKVTIDLGNDVQIFTDPSKDEGVSGAHVVNRDPKVTIDPDLVSPSSQDFWGRWKAGTTGALVTEIGSSTKVTSSALQVEKAYSPGEREGHVVNNMTFSIKNDDLTILQGAVA